MASLLWTDVTLDDIQLPAVDVSQQLGLPPDPTPDQSPPWQDLSDQYSQEVIKENDLEASSVQQLKAENKKLRDRANDAKKLLNLYDRQKTELRAARKRLVSVEAENKKLLTKVHALKTLISELESDAPNKRRRTETDSILINGTEATSSLGSPTLPCLYCKHGSIDPAPKPLPLLSAQELENFLCHEDGCQAEDLSHISQVRDLARLQVSKGHVLTSVEDVVAVFAKVLIIEDASASRDKVFKILSALSSSQQPDSVYLRDALLLLIKRALTDPHTAISTRAVCVYRLFQGRRFNIWDASTPVFALVEYLASNAEQGVLKPPCISESEMTDVLQKRHENDLLSAVCQTLLNVFEDRAEPSPETDEVHSDFATNGRIELSVRLRCTRIISASAPAGKEGRRMAGTALFLECCMLPPSAAYECIIKNCLWPALPSAIAEPDFFCVLLSCIGSICSHIAKDSKGLAFQAVEVTIGRLLLMLDATGISSEVRAAALDAVVTIALKGGQQVHDRIYDSVQKWAQHLGPSGDDAFISERSRAYLDQLNIWTPVSD